MADFAVNLTIALAKESRELAARAIVGFLAA